jgi:two-component system sensor histidine kinase CpxA
MRSLFAKTLLWFLATTAVAIAGIIITTAVTLNSTESRQSPFFMLLRVQVEDAKRAYETGGKAALAAVLSKFQSIDQAKVVFTDDQGNDLLSGEHRPDLANRMGRRPSSSFPFTFNRQFTFARPDSTRKYWLFVIEERRGWLFWFLEPSHLWIVGLVVLLCYGFAYHLTSPVRRLREAVDCFGRGDFSARAATNRRDELGQLALSFNKMADRIQTLLSAERRLLLDISHELRSPLARLSVAVELARSGKDRDVMLDRIEKEADRLNELVGELLQVTRAEGDPSLHKTATVHLDELLGDIVYDAQLEAKAKGVTVDVKSSQPIALTGDEELIRRAVENVVRNAIRYAPQGTAVEIQIERIADRAQVIVRDFGPGVPEEALPRIFDPFYRVDSDRNRASGGVGLGLAIARRAVELHKGKLQARNVNPGLLVTIDLPVAQESTAPEPGKQPVAAR